MCVILFCCDRIIILYNITGGIDHIQVCINSHIQKIRTCGRRYIHGHDLIIFALQIGEGENITNVIADTILGCQFFGVILQHVRTEFSAVTVVVHHKRFNFGCKDLYGSLAVKLALLYGKACHSSKKFLQLLLCGNEIAKRIKDNSLITFAVGKSSIRLENMRMTADNNINPMFHKVGSPLFLILRRHSLIFSAPVSNKNDAVSLFFGLFDHGGDLGLVKYIDHIITSLNPPHIGSVGVIQKSDLNTVNLPDLYSICILLGIVDTYEGHIRIFGFPEVESIGQEIITKIINMVCGRFNNIKTSFDNSIAYLCRCSKRRIGAYAVMVSGKNGFLIDHLYICRLNGIQDMGIDLVIIPVSGIGFTGIDQGLMIKIIPYCDDRCSAGNRSILLIFLLLPGDLSLLPGILGRFAYQAVIQLVKKQDQHSQNPHRCQKTGTGITPFFDI